MIDLRPTIDRLGLGLIRNCNCQRDCGRVIRQAKKGRTQTNPNPIDEENVGIQIQFQISFFYDRPRMHRLVTITSSTSVTDRQWTDNMWQ